MVSKGSRSILFSYVSVGVAVLAYPIFANPPCFVERSPPAIEFSRGTDVRCRSGRPVDVILDIAFIERHESRISGNRPSNPSSEASQMPRSVIRPVTSRAGVTSNA